MTKVLVTGALGFIGSAFLSFVSEKPDIVVHVVNHLQSETSQKNFGIWSSVLLHRLHIIDIEDYEPLARLIEKEQFDVVLHLAARAGVRNSSLHPRVYCRTNVDGTLNILEAVRLFSPHTRCIMASSSTVHGNPISSFYGLTKKMVEDIAELYCRLHGLHIACLRFFSVYGTDCRQDLLIGHILSSVQNNTPVTIFGDGSVRRDFTYIDDTLEAIYQTLHKKWSGYLVADIGTGENHSVVDVLNMIETFVPTPIDVLYTPRKKEDQAISKAHVENARKELNFETKVPLREGLKRCFLSMPCLSSSDNT